MICSLFYNPKPWLPFPTFQSVSMFRISYRLCLMVTCYKYTVIVFIMLLYSLVGNFLICLSFREVQLTCGTLTNLHSYWNCSFKLHSTSWIFNAPLLLLLILQPILVYFPMHLICPWAFADLYCCLQIWWHRLHNVKIEAWQVVPFQWFALRTCWTSLPSTALLNVPRWHERNHFFPPILQHTRILHPWKLYDPTTNLECL